MPGRARLDPQRLQIAGRQGVAIVRLPLLDRAHLLDHEAADRVAQHDQMVRKLPSPSQIGGRTGHCILIYHISIFYYDIRYLTAVFAAIKRKLHRRGAFI
jgi:hypothetical protein